VNLTIFGATGALGSECLEQALEAGHDVTVLVRTPEKLTTEARVRTRVAAGDALDEEAVRSALSRETDAVLFAIGIDKRSPEDLCTDITRHILAAMPDLGIRRLVWCGGGSTLVEQDEVGFGERFVELFASTFMGLRHRDKAHQLELLKQHPELEWVGLRPLQMRSGAKRGEYRIGFDRFSGFSQISFADCADAMLAMLEDERWLQQAPIIQY
jgi:putative NADH-flavin reductase